MTGEKDKEVEEEIFVAVYKGFKFSMHHWQEVIAFLRV
jgi:hypothetical protein